jgi:putative membrane protein
MEWRIIAINFFYAVLGVVLMFMAYKIFDLLTPQLNFPEELKKNNIAVAIFIAALFISIGIIVGGALN